MIKLFYAYPSSPIGGRNGCYYTQGANGKLARRIKYANEGDAIYGTHIRHAGHVIIELQYGPPERADKYRHVGVVSAMDHTQPAA